MSKLAVAGQVPARYEGSIFRRILGAIEVQLNGLTEGRMAVRHFTDTATPTVGNFAKGDIVWNSAPAEAGGAGSKYVVLGWICTAAGSPGTFKDMRVLTGN